MFVDDAAGSPGDAEEEGPAVLGVTLSGDCPGSVGGDDLAPLAAAVSASLMGPIISSGVSAEDARHLMGICHRLQHGTTPILLEIQGLTEDPEVQLPSWREVEMWLVWCMGVMVGGCLVLSLIEKPPFKR